MSFIRHATGRYTEMRIVAQVLDGTYGKPAAGVSAHLAQAVSGNGWEPVGQAETNDDGLIEEWDSWQLERGLYRITLDSDRHFARLGTITAYPEVVVIFRMQDTAHDVQVQVTLTPHSYSIYLGVIDKSAWVSSRTR